MSPDDIQLDINAFDTALETRFAYLHANNASYKASLERLMEKASGLSPTLLGLELQKILALFIDGHARVRDMGLSGPLKRFLPFRVAALEDSYVALEGQHLLDRGYPYLTHLDGEGLEWWLEIAHRFVAKGSPQLVKERSLSWLTPLQILRLELGKALEPEVRLRLTNAAGEDKEIEVELQPSPPKPARRQPTEGKYLNGKLGYLRLARMNREALEAVNTWLPRFSDTRGLVLDLRGNRGGTREAGLELLSYLSPPKSPPRVINVAKYRIHPAHPLDHLYDRHLYPHNWQAWTARDKETLEMFATRFTPEWHPDTASFSDWHCCLTRPREDGAFYDKPVLVLMDTTCFSAADILLSALKACPQVTLLGQASGGGSGKGQVITLPSGMKIVLASMASFQANGLLFDTHGVLPDVQLEPTLSDLLGKTDGALETARTRLAG